MAKYARLTRSTVMAYVVIAMVLTYVCVRPAIHGLHRHLFFEPDSIGYLSLASSIWKGHGYHDFTGNWCSDWPPLYPLTVGLLVLITNNQVFAVGLAGSINLALTLIFTALCLRKITNSIALQLCAIIVVALSVPLTNLANSGLSESLFVPLTIGSLYFAAEYTERRRKSDLVYAALLALGCCLTRYIGVTLVAALATTIALSKDTRMGDRVWTVAVFLGIALLPFFGWCWLNKQFTDTWMGERDPGIHTFKECISALVSCVQDMFATKFLARMTLCEGLIAVVVTIFARASKFCAHHKAAILFTLSYATVIVWSSARYNIDMVDSRLTSPLFVPIILSFVGFIEMSLQSLPEDWRKPIIAVSSALLLTIAVSSCTMPQVPSGGYLADEWQRSATLAYVKSASLDDTLYTNDNVATYLLAHKNAECIGVDNESPTLSYVVSSLHQLPTNSYVIWLYNAIEPEDFEVDKVKTRCGLRVIATFSDGVIFQRIGKRQGSASST